MTLIVKSAKPTRQYGYVYILTNPAMPGLLKIGHTARYPEARAAELSAATGVPGRFVVAYSHPVRDHEALEALAHGRLARCRANENREFFRCTVEEARRIIEQEARAQLLPWWRVLLHRLVHPLPRAARPARRWQRRGRRHQPGDLLGFYGVVLGVIGAWLIFTFRPVLPSWMPASLTSAAYAIERLHQ